MKLRALRGAITVAQNDSGAILAATDELVREVMVRNGLRDEDLVSCIFTCTEVVSAWPSFSIYPHCAAMSGARAIPVTLNEEGEHDLETMPREVTAATRLVIVCNPNNPSATALPPAAIDAFAAELPRHVALVLDEAYVEFSTLQDPDESIDLLE